MFKNLILNLLLLVSATICYAQINNPIIHNVRLFDGNKVYENMTIVTENEKIIEISQTAEITKTSENVINGTGYTLLPGLINAHFHTRSKKNLEEAAASGVLCILDMKINSSLSFTKLKELSKEPKYPYFFSTDIAVTVPKGHAAGIKKETVQSEENTGKFVGELIDGGADFVKIVLDNGFNNNRPTLTDKMLETTIQVATARNKLTVAHIAAYDDAVKVASMGVSGLAHVWIFDSLQIPEKKLQILKSSDIFIVPTLYVYQRGIDLKGWPINMEYVKSDVLRLYEAGIPILAGSDPGNNKVNYGDDMIQELKQLASCGIPNLEVLKSATSNASNAFHLGDIGFVKEGASADFILVKGDPTVNIDDLYNLEGIWKNGRFITPNKK